MAQELIDGKITGSSSVAKAGLTLGIIGTGLAALSGMNGGLGGLFGRNDGQVISGMQSAIDQLQAEKYADGRYLDLYTKLVASNEANNAKLNGLQTQLYEAVMDLDKRTALNEQASILNREYDSTVRDYMMTIINNKIDCCCDKMNMKADYEKQISELADAAILSYVNSNFVSRNFKNSSI